MTVTVGGTASTDVTVDTDGATSGDQSTLTFTTTDWSTAQTVTVAAAEDTDGTDDTVTLAHTASGGGYASVTGDLVVTVDDDTFSPPTITDISLLNAPSTYYQVGRFITVQVTFSKAVSFEASSDRTKFAKIALTIGEQTRYAFRRAETLLLDDQVLLQYRVAEGDSGPIRIAANALDFDGDVFYRKGGSASTTGDHADPTHAAKDLGAHVGGPTAVTDLAVVPGNGQLTVTWTAASYAPRGYLLRWREQRRGTTLSTVTPSTSGRIITGLKNDQAHIVRVDTLDANGNVVSGTHRTVVGTPALVRGVVLAPAALTVGEGASATYTVKLATQPTAAVTVTLAGTAGTDVTVDRSTLAFTTTNWDDPQTVTVTAAAGRRYDRRHGHPRPHRRGRGLRLGDRAPRGDGGRRRQPGARASRPPRVTVGEGASAAYTVRLATQPSAAVTVTVGGTASTDVTVDTDGATSGDQSTLDLHDHRLEHRADGDGGGGAGRGRGRRHRHPRPRGRGRGLRLDVAGTVTVTVDDDDDPGPDLHAHRADGGRGRERRLHGGAGDAAERRP